MADLSNEFSWSRSRDATFQDCRRKYYLHYYGAWGGWAADAAADVRLLYVLKQLASRQMWGGRVVHDAIEMALHVYQQGRDVPVEPFVADVIEPDPTAFQLGCYALYAREVLGVPAAQVVLLEVNLREPTVTPLAWDDGRLEAIREQLRLSIRSMRAYLAEPAANVARQEDF